MTTEPPRTVTFGDPAAMTAEERTGAQWLVRFVLYFVGAGSVIAILYIGALGLYYAWIFTGDLKSWVAISGSWMALTLLCAGLPIAAGLTWDSTPAVAKTAGGLWLICMLTLAALNGRFAVYSPPAASAPMTAVSAFKQAAPIDEHTADLDLEIESLSGALAEGDAEQDYGWKTQRVEIERRLRKAQQERYGYFGAPPVASQAPARTAAVKPRSSLDTAALTAVMLIICGLGAGISAAALNAIMTTKAREHAKLTMAAMQQPALPAIDVTPVEAWHSGESQDGFAIWAARCVSRVEGGKVRSGEAHEHYVTFCGANGFPLPLASQEFGRRFRAWLLDTYGIDGRHSGGTVYDGIALNGGTRRLAAPVA